MNHAALGVSIQPIKKILIVNIFGIGDVLFTTPLIANLKTAYPDIYIGYICNRRVESFLDRNPKINKIFVYERDEMEVLRQKSTFQYLKAVNGFIQEIKNEGFDISLDVSLSNFMGFCIWLAGVARRIGFDYKGRGYFLNHKVYLQGYEQRHVVEYYLDFLADLGVPIKHKAMELPLTKEDTDWALRFMEENEISSRVVVGLVPGGGESWGKDSLYKRWPAERFAKLADKLIEKFNAQIILMGSLSEVELCHQIISGMHNPCFLSCGKTSLNQFAALAARCRLIVTNDGGPLHVAVAAGCKTVSIFGPVDEAVYGPYPFEGQRVIKKNLACQPCYRRFRRSDCNHIRCLADLSVEEVLKEVEKAL